MYQRNIQNSHSSHEFSHKIAAENDRNSKKKKQTHQNGIFFFNSSFVPFPLFKFNLIHFNNLSFIERRFYCKVFLKILWHYNCLVLNMFLNSLIISRCSCSMLCMKENIYRKGTGMSHQGGVKVKSRAKLMF